MLDRLESISRLLCIGLGALLFLQLVNAVWHGDPLGRATIPDLPTLPAAAPSDAPPAPVLTNSTPAKTNTSPARTNSAPVNTNSAAIKTNSVTTKTNSAPARTNSAPVNTNSAAIKTNSVTTKTNSASAAIAAGPHSRRPGPMGGRKADLPPAVQARVDRIVESEILGPFIRPMPMALLGIAGDDAFLRAPDGQTGMVKEGADLGAIKLLRIGTNRVLVEENGEKKELTLFAGMGGESLLPPETNSTIQTNVPITKKEAH